MFFTSICKRNEYSHKHALLIQGFDVTFELRSVFYCPTILTGVIIGVIIWFSTKCNDSVSLEEKNFSCFGKIRSEHYCKCPSLELTNLIGC